MKREHKGYVDKIEGGDLLGWVWDPLHPEERWEVELLQDGEVVSEAFADGYREDLAEADIGDGMYGFQLPLPDGPIKIDSEGSLVIRVKNCGTQLSLAEQCTTQLQLENYNELLNTVELLPTHDLSRGIGRIERREGNRIIGWLVSGVHPATPVVLIDGKPATTATLTSWKNAGAPRSGPINPSGTSISMPGPTLALSSPNTAPALPGNCSMPCSSISASKSSLEHGSAPRYTPSDGNDVPGMPHPLVGCDQDR